MHSPHAGRHHEENTTATGRPCHARRDQRGLWLERTFRDRRRQQLRETMEEGIGQMWPAEMRRPAHVAPNVQAGNIAYGAIHGLSPHNDTQAALKAQAAALAVDVAQVRTLLAAQSVPSISKPMLIILVSWLVVIFLGFSVLAPPNTTTILALMVSALAVSGAIFLILELDEPFGGLIGISSEPMLNALSQLAR